MSVGFGGSETVHDTRRKAKVTVVPKREEPVTKKPWVDPTVTQVFPEDIKVTEAPEQFTIEEPITIPQTVLDSIRESASRIKEITDEFPELLADLDGEEEDPNQDGNIIETSGEALEDDNFDLFFSDGDENSDKNETLNYIQDRDTTSDKKPTKKSKKSNL